MDGTMKAIVKVRPEPNGSEMQEVPIPKTGPNDVLIRMKAVSICGTDVHIFNWDAWSQSRIKPPLIYGHEFGGEVVEVGSNVESKHVKVGDYVSGEGHIACGYCYNCHHGMAHICQNGSIFGVDSPGIFAEYAAIPALNVWHNDPDLPPELASIQDPLGNAVHCVMATGVTGRDVVVLGLGPIGLMIVNICKALGASRVFAVGRKNMYRVDLSKKLGADFALSAQDDIPAVIRSETGGKGADVVFEISGSTAALNMGFDVLRQGGDVILLGLYNNKADIDLNRSIVFKYATVKGINGRLMFETWHTMKGLFRNPNFDVSPVITHKMKFDDFFEGMEIMRSGQCGKVALFL